MTGNGHLSDLNLSFQIYSGTKKAPTATVGALLIINLALQDFLRLREATPKPKIPAPKSNKVLGSGI